MLELAPPLHGCNILRYNAQDDVTSKRKMVMKNLQALLQSPGKSISQSRTHEVEDLMQRITDANEALKRRQDPNKVK